MVTLTGTFSPPAHAIASFKLVIISWPTLRLSADLFVLVRFFISACLPIGLHQLRHRVPQFIPLGLWQVRLAFGRPTEFPYSARFKNHVPHFLTVVETPFFPRAFDYTLLAYPYSIGFGLRLTRCKQRQPPEVFAKSLRLCMVVCRQGEAMSGTRAKSTTARSETINLRASRKQKAMIDRAPEALGRTRSDLMLDTACREAESVLMDRRYFALPAE